MRTLALASLFFATACPQQGAPPAAPAPSAPAGPAATPSPVTPWTAAQQACVDAWLSAHSLDAFGSPQGTQYAGGTPLFDERSGQTTSRQDFLARRKPEALKSCGL